MSDESIFAEALGIGSPAERSAFLDRACAGNAALRAEVQALLAAHAASNPLDQPPADVARTGAYAPERAESPDEAVGAVLASKYKLVELIGAGGMGAVYMAQQTEPVKRLVAVKVIRDGMDTRQVLARFEAERQALALMDHPNIAKVLDAGTTDRGRPFFVMELVKGVPITEFCDARKLSPRERLELFVPVCQAIQHAHQKGVIHRDIKPSNVLVALYDGKPVPKVIDFGVAKAAGQPLTDKTLVTGFGAIVGTPEYMSPEQAELNQLDIDTRSDVFALGVLLYELLTGTTPLNRSQLGKAALLEVLRIVREVEPPKPSTRVSTSDALASIAANRNTDPVKLSKLMRGELDWIVMKALEKDRNRRYESATALAKDVERHLSGDAVEACPPTFGYRLRKAYRRNRAAVLGGGAFALVLLAGVCVSVAFGLMAKRAGEEAERKRIEADDSAEEARKAQGETDKQRIAAEAAGAEAQRVADLQRRTRYAAEMTLLQTAYDSGNMAEVKRLLDDQRPVAGEPDLRGPEWHFWDRKLNGQRREVRIAYAEPKEPYLESPFGVAGQIALSPDGHRLATIVIAHDSAALTKRAIIRVWDTTTGARLHQRNLTDNGLQLAPTFDTNPPEIRFGGDGRHVFLSGAFVKAEPKGEPTKGSNSGERTFATWDLATDQLRVHPVGGVGGRQEKYWVSDSLEYLCCVSSMDDGSRFGSPSPVKRPEPTVRVVRLTDGKEVLTFTPRPSARVRPAFSPDGKYIVLHWYEPSSARGDGGNDLPATNGEMQVWRERRYCYELGTAAPVWESNPIGPPAFRILNLGTIHFGFNTEQKTYWCSSLEGSRRTHAQMTYHLQTGKGASETRIAEQVKVPTATVGQLPQSPFRARADGASVALSHERGLQVLGTTSEPAVLESIDGPPEQFGYAADGSLVTVHIHNETAVVRHWSPPPAAPRQLVGPPTPQPGDKFMLANAVASPDESAFAVLVTKPTKDDEFPSTFGDGYVPGVPERVVVLGSDGRERLSVDCASLPIQRVIHLQTTSGPVVFSTDGNFVMIARSEREPGTDTRRDRVGIWNMARKEEHVLQVSEKESIADATVNDARDRLLIRWAERAVSTPGTRPPPTPTRLMLYEFPSGKPICELKKPPGESHAIAFFAGDRIMGRSVSAEGRLMDTYFSWDARTGNDIGPAPAPEILRHPYASQEVRRGVRVLRTFTRFGTDGRSWQPTGVLELWDAAKMGPNDQPVLRREYPSAIVSGNLSPDGSRLIAVSYAGNGGDLDTMRRGVMYDTVTGRPLLTLPGLATLPVRKMGANPWGYWSADSRLFWLSVTRDCKMDGYDFRPREGTE